MGALFQMACVLPTPGILKRAYGSGLALRNRGVYRLQGPTLRCGEATIQLPEPGFYTNTHTQSKQFLVSPMGPILKQEAKYPHIVFQGNVFVPLTSILMQEGKRAVEGHSSNEDIVNVFPHLSTFISPPSPSSVLIYRVSTTFLLAQQCETGQARLSPQPLPRHHSGRESATDRGQKGHQTTPSPPLPSKRRPDSSKIRCTNKTQGQ